MKQAIVTAALLACLMNCLTSLVSAGGFAVPAVTPLPFKECWSVKLDDTEKMSLGSDGETVFLTDGKARALALSSATGERLWATELGGDTVSNLYAGQQGVVLVTRSPGTKTQQPVPIVHSLSRDTGVTLWTAEIDGEGSVFIGGDNGKIAAITTSGKVSVFDESGGKRLWDRQFPDISTASVWIGDGRLAFSTERGDLLVLAVASGETLIKTVIGGTATAVLLPDEETAIWGDESGHVVSRNLETGKNNWVLKQGAKVSAISAFGDGILVASFDNFVYFVSIESGNVRWKKRQPGRVSRTYLFDSRDLVLAGYGESSAAVVDAENGKVSGQLLSSSPFLAGPVSAADSVVFGTAEGVNAFRQKGCDAKQKAGGK